MATSAALDELLQNLGSSVVRGDSPGAGRAGRSAFGEAPNLVLGWPEVDALLPGGGLPRGVIELSSPHALGGATSVALTAIRAAHARDARAWCAWVDPEGSLYAPGVAMAGVDLARLLVVRPPRAELGRTAVKVASARAFDVIVVDMDAPPATATSAATTTALATTTTAPATAKKPRKRAWPVEVLVRKLALLAEEGGATVLLLTDAMAAATRQVPWPVAMRLELARFSPMAMSLRIAKDKRGHSGSHAGGLAKTVPLATRPTLATG